MRTSSEMIWPERVRDRPQRAGDVRLQDDPELLGLPFLELVEEILQGRLLAGARLRDGGVPRLLDDRPGRLLVRDDAQDVARLRHLAEPQHERRGRRAGLLDPLPGRVLERLDLAVGLADHDDVADPEGARLDDDGGHRAAALVQLGLDDRPDRLALRVCLELLEVGDQVHHVEQVVEALARLRRDLHERDVAAVLLDHDVRLGQLGLDPIRVRVRLVDLVEGDDDRHLGRPGVGDRLEGLGHDAVVGRDHDDRDVGDLGAPGSHGRERLVPRRVEEDDLLVVLDDLRRADVLGDPAALPGRHRRAPDRVEQARLAVVDVAHDGHDRRARHEQGWGPRPRTG